MTHDFEIGAVTGQCAATGRTFEEGEEFYTVLLEQGDSFARVDYSVEAWQGPPENAYCHFKTRVPIKEKQKKMLVDNELLVSFFQRLADETEPVRIQFRFVLALILMRKRRLRYDSSAVEDEVETWTMTLMHDRSSHRIINPQLTDEQIEGVSRELTAILHSDMGHWTTMDEVPSAAPEDADQDEE